MLRGSLELGGIFWSMTRTFSLGLVFSEIVFWLDRCFGAHGVDRCICSRDGRGIQGKFFAPYAEGERKGNTEARRKGRGGRRKEESSCKGAKVQKKKRGEEGRV
jgi:hypothetical protein